VSDLCNDVATYLEKEWKSIKQASEELEKYGKKYKTE